jgi:hypothetical protein
MNRQNDNNTNALPARYKNTINKIRSCDWLEDDDINLLCKTFTEIGSEALGNILYLNGFIKKEKLLSLRDPSGMTKEEQEVWNTKKTIIMDTEKLEILISRIVSGHIFEEYLPLETEKQVVVITENGVHVQREIRLPKPNAELRIRQTNSSKPPLKKTILDPDPRYFKKFKIDTNTATFDYYEVLENLGLELNENWLEDVCLLLIPVNGPHTTLDYLQRDRVSYLEGLRNHWSLLCYSPWTKTIYHYDSLLKEHGTLNTRRAEELIKIFKMFRLIPMDTKEILTYYPNWIPEQSFGYECGYYVCYFILMMMVKMPNRPLSSKDIQEKYAKFVDVAKANAFTDLIKKILWEKYSIDCFLEQ